MSSCGEITRDGSVPNMCTSGGCQCKTILIQGLCVLGHHKQTWTFPLRDITIKLAKCTKYEIKAYNFFRFLVPNICTSGGHQCKTSNFT